MSDAAESSAGVSADPTGAPGAHHQQRRHRQRHHGGNGGRRAGMSKASSLASFVDPVSPLTIPALDAFIAAGRPASQLGRSTSPLQRVDSDPAARSGTAVPKTANVVRAALSVSDCSSAPGAVESTDGASPDNHHHSNGIAHSGPARSAPGSASGTPNAITAVKSAAAHRSAIKAYVAVPSGPRRLPHAATWTDFQPDIAAVVDAEEECPSCNASLASGGALLSRQPSATPGVGVANEDSMGPPSRSHDACRHTSDTANSSAGNSRRLLTVSDGPSRGRQRHAAAPQQKRSASARPADPKVLAEVSSYRTAYFCGKPTAEAFARQQARRLRDAKRRLRRVERAEEERQAKAAEQRASAFAQESQRAVRAMAAERESEAKATAAREAHIKKLEEAQARREQALERRAEAQRAAAAHREEVRARMAALREANTVMHDPACRAACEALAPISHIVNYTLHAAAASHNGPTTADFGPKFAGPSPITPHPYAAMPDTTAAATDGDATDATAAATLPSPAALNAEALEAAKRLPPFRGRIRRFCCELYGRATHFDCRESVEQALVEDPWLPCPACGGDPPEPRVCRVTGEAHEQQLPAAANALLEALLAAAAVPSTPESSPQKPQRRPQATAATPPLQATKAADQSGDTMSPLQLNATSRLQGEATEDKPKPLDTAWLACGTASDPAAAGATAASASHRAAPTPGESPTTPAAATAAPVRRGGRPSALSPSIATAANTTHAATTTPQQQLEASSSAAFLQNITSWQRLEDPAVRAIVCRQLVGAHHAAVEFLDPRRRGGADEFSADHVLAGMACTLVRGLHELVRLVLGDEGDDTNSVEPTGANITNSPEGAGSNESTPLRSRRKSARASADAADDDAQPGRVTHRAVLKLLQAWDAYSVTAAEEELRKKKAALEAATKGYVGLRVAEAERQRDISQRTLAAAAAGAGSVQAARERKVAPRRAALTSAVARQTQQLLNRLRTIGGDAAVRAAEARARAAVAEFKAKADAAAAGDSRVEEIPADDDQAAPAGKGAEHTVANDGPPPPRHQRRHRHHRGAPPAEAA